MICVCKMGMQGRMRTVFLEDNAASASSHTCDDNPNGIAPMLVGDLYRQPNAARLAGSTLLGLVVLSIY